MVESSTGTISREVYVKRKIVLANTYTAFMHWCYENGVNPRGRDVIYASDRYKLLGLCLCDKHAEIIRYQNYNSHPNFPEIFDTIQRGKAMGHHD